VTVERLLEELDLVVGTIRRSLPAAILRLPKLQRLRFRFLDVTTFDGQRDLLAGVDAGVRQALATDDFDRVCLFLAGSAAKLEYLARVSDLDFLGVDAASDGSEEFRALDTTAHFTGAQEETQRFAEFTEDLELAIGQQLDSRGLARTKVEVGAEPLLGSSTFFNRQDVFERLGNEREPSYAPWARAVLLFEAVGWGAPEDVSSLRSKADEVYGASADVASGVFPAVACAFVSHLATSGLMAKLNLLRQLRENDDDDSVDDEESEERRRSEAELLKAVFSRQWYCAVNRIVLHALYWHSTEAEKDEELDAERIREILRAAPIGKLVLHLPSLLSTVYSWRGPLWKQVQAGTRLRSAKRFLDLMDRVYIACGQLTAANGNRVPLWCRFLQILKLCADVRSGDRKLDYATLRFMEQVGRELESVLKDCVWLTRQLQPSPSKAKANYQRLAALVANEIA